MKLRSLFPRAAFGVIAGFLLFSAQGEEVRPTPPQVPETPSTGTVEAARNLGYIRFDEDKDGARLETAVVHYKRDDGAQVALVGAIHVGDEAYYQALNEHFKKYDEVLFELVGDPQYLIDKEAAKNRPDRSAAMDVVSGMQTMLKKFLDLTHQLDQVDYTPKNFVHADMDTATFLRRQEERGEGFLKMWFRSVMEQMRKDLSQEKAAPVAGQEGPSFVEMLGLMVKGEAAPELKRFMGRQMTQIDDMMGAMEGPDGSVIVTERNIAAFDVLKSSLEKGVKNIAVFYGAAHLPDMDERLKAMGFKETEREWFTAWSIPPSKWSAKTGDAGN